MGFINGKLIIKDDSYFSIITDNEFCEISTNKERLSKINFSKLKVNENTKKYQIDFLNFDNDEYINNIYFSKNLIN